MPPVWQGSTEPDASRRVRSCMGCRATCNGERHISTDDTIFSIICQENLTVSRKSIERLWQISIQF